jgi:hypothetical protein
MSNYEMTPTFTTSINRDLTVRIELVVEPCNATDTYSITIRNITCVESGRDWTMYLNHNVVLGSLWGNKWVPEEVAL